MYMGEFSWHSCVYFPQQNFNRLKYSNRMFIGVFLSTTYCIFRPPTIKMNLKQTTAVATHPAPQASRTAHKHLSAPKAIVNVYNPVCISSRASDLKYPHRTQTQVTILQQHKQRSPNLSLPKSPERSYQTEPLGLERKHRIPTQLPNTPIEGTPKSVGHQTLPRGETGPLAHKQIGS